MGNDRIDVPAKFNKNAQYIHDMGPEHTGERLLRHLEWRLGRSLRDLDVLDIGCGVRFTRTIINRKIPVGTYTGIDVDAEMIGWLRGNVQDERFKFLHWDARNPYYNPKGVSMEEFVSIDWPRKFDVVTMFSVITHQKPKDAARLFKLARLSIKDASSRMFFTAHIGDGGYDYRELTMQECGFSSYSLSAIRDLLAETGWFVASMLEREYDGLPMERSFLAGPV